MDKRKKKNQAGVDMALRGVSSAVGMVLKVAVTIALIILLTGSMCAAAFAVYLDRYVAVDLDIDIDVTQLQMDQNSFIYYTDKETGQPVEMRQLHGAQNRVWANFNEIPKDLVNAFIAIEDERFPSHHGVDWKRTAKAILDLVTGSGTSGGSTITQQFIKNWTGEDDVSIQRKIQEIARALELEKHIDKDQIIELYLNTINLSQGAYGVRAAAEVYFGKDVSTLTLAECACIAGITNLPTYYDPIQNPENNKRRQELILMKMEELGYITAAQRAAAAAQPLNFTRSKDVPKETDYQSYFEDQVIEDVIKAFMGKKGYTEGYAAKLVYSGGLQIFTTFDPAAQKIVDDIYADADNFVKLAGREQPQSATIIIDLDGNIVAMIGGRGEKSLNRGFNRATHAKRQPGSTMKPMTAYAPALEYGYLTPYSVVDDAPVEIDANDKPYPVNYNRRFQGLMSVMDAVRNSLNPPAMRTVMGITPDTAFRFGSTNLNLTSLVDIRVKSSGTVYSDIDRAPMSLGGVTDGLTLREMADAYATFPNKGMYRKSRTFTHVLDSEGKMLLDNTIYPEVVMKEKTAFYLNLMLSEVMLSGTGMPARLQGMTCAGKTGTTSNELDRWFVGYTPYYVAVTWMGYDQPREMKGLQSNPTVPVWKAIMQRLHEGLDSVPFFEMNNIVKAEYCVDSGCKPGPYCSLDPRGNRVRTGQFAAEDVPVAKCTAHVPVDVCPETGQLATPYCPHAGRTQRALVNYTREYSVAVGVEDSQYLYRKYIDPYLPAVNTDDEQPMIPSVAVTDGKSPAANSYCTLHTALYIPPPYIPPDGNGGDNPYDPGDGGDDDDAPFYTGDPSVQGSPGGDGHDAAPPPVADPQVAALPPDKPGVEKAKPAA